jgi:hypothetical protein
VHASAPASPLSPHDEAFFRQHGYLVLPPLSALFDRDYKNHAYLWRPFGDQTINCDALASSPGVDLAIRHPRILPIITALMGGPTVFSEICLRHMRPHDGSPRQGWHRDRPHWLDHPLRLDYLQLMIYLTAVSEQSHCFSISPEAVDQPILAKAEDQLTRGGRCDLHGPPGTAILFNVSVLHSATLRRTQIERKTIQIYYGHADRPYLSNDSIIPATLWHCHPDPATRAFYGKLNDKTRHFLAGTGLPL